MVVAIGTEATVEVVVVEFDALQVFEQRLSREILCTVKAHMLEEVCKTVLVVFLLERTHVCRQIELGALCRQWIVANVIGQSILKFSDPYSRLSGARHC